MNVKLISQVEQARHDVFVDSYSQTWSDLLDQYRRNDVKVDPDYQRAFRWTLDQQSQYIESLLLSIPTPPLFMAEMEDGSFEIIDGLQRFSTLLKFFSDEIFTDGRVAPHHGGYNHDNDVAVPTVLSEPPILNGLAGLTKVTLPETLVRTIRYSRVQVTLIKRESSELSRYHVFTRLNRAGTVLSNQEIRNCSARLFNPEFADKLMKIGADERIVSAMSMSESDEKSMGVQENVLRLVAFLNGQPETQRIDEFLDSAMYLAATGKIKFTKRVEEKIYRTFEIVSRDMPAGSAFRFPKGGVFKGAFSTNLFDIVACGVFNNIESAEKKPIGYIEERVVAMHEDPKVKVLTGAGSNTRAKMMGRVEFGTNWFSK